MALSYSNITIELREILLKARPESLIEISLKGTVPVLQLLNGFVIDESMDIMKWAIQHSNFLKLMNDNLELQKLLINKNDTEFKIWLDRYKYNDRNKNYSLDECKLKCGEILNGYENLLKDSKYFIADSVSFCDIAIFPFVRQFSNVNSNYFIATYPKLNNWLRLIIESELFLSVMKKYPQWKFGDNPQIINFKENLIHA